MLSPLGRSPRQAFAIAAGLSALVLLVGLDQWSRWSQREQAEQLLRLEQKSVLQSALQDLAALPKASEAEIAVRVQSSLANRTDSSDFDESRWMLLYSPAEQRLVDLSFVSPVSNEKGQPTISDDQGHIQRSLSKLPELDMQLEEGAMKVRQVAVHADLAHHPMQGRIRVSNRDWIVTLGSSRDSTLMVGIAQPTQIADAYAAYAHFPVRVAIVVVGLCVVFVSGVLILNQQANEGEPVAHVEGADDKQASKESQVADQRNSLYDSRNVRTREAVILGMARLSESRGEGNGCHVDRIREYTRILAEQLQSKYDQIDGLFIHNLSLAAALHDIGMVGVPESILNKTGPLSPEERQVINRHSTIGGDCLASLQEETGSDEFLRMAFEIAYYHHERWDGLGYPAGLSHERIPLTARIVTVADVYEALTTDRPYKRAFPHVQAVSIITDGSGRQFDPTVVEAFLDREDEFRAAKEQFGLQDDAELVERMAAIEAFIERGEQTVEGAARAIGSVELC